MEDGAGLLNVLVTISATTRGDSPSNLTNWEEDLDSKKATWTEEYVSFAQCGNLRIFLSLRFYVKSMLAVLEIAILTILSNFSFKKLQNFT